MFTNNVYVTVNGLPLHGTDSYGSEWIVNKTDGFLDGAPSTLATTQKIWSHGVFTNQPFYTGRVVSLEGYVRGTTAENAILSWDSLKQALSLDMQDVAINWRGYKRLLRGKQSGQPLVEWFDRYTLKFSLEFTSNTPFLYSAGDALSGSTYLPSASGGMTFPYAFEGDGTVNDWGFPEVSVSGSVTLNNHGTASSPVIITISGYVVNPRIEHRQTGAVLALDYTIPVGETVVLNSETREVLINGKIPSQQIVSSRQWFTAGPGENTFMFSADSASEESQSTAAITTKNAPESILNGGFTYGTANWDLKPNIDVVSVSGRGNVLHAVMDGPKAFGSIAQHSVGQRLGYSEEPRSIMVSWDYYVNSRNLSGESTFVVNVRLGPDDEFPTQLGHRIDTPALGQWLHFEDIYDLPANNAIDKFWFQGLFTPDSGTVDMYLDNISVKDLTAAAKELVTDGSFELGDSPYWTIENAPDMSINSNPDGSHSGNYRFAGNTNPADVAPTLTSQQFKVLPGRRLRLSCWFWNDGNIQAATAKIVYNNGESSKIDISSKTDYWAYKYIDVKVPDGASTGYVRITYWSPGQSVFARVDGISVKDLTEAETNDSDKDTATVTVEMREAWL